ncbi:serine/threonine-protein kinase 11-interacting protein-like isoform X2 [Rhopilema esculentum]|uniref:serine/threonine-protein kinase 11-interacting protein-like isoform X2 n=1 Tax=Rhopilema esculentum TaxID=499914 RepID=UPI0031CFCF36
MFSWFRKKKKDQTNNANPVEQLANILREYGGLILEGNGRLCLTTPILIALNRDFQHLTFTRDSSRHGDSAFDVIKQEGPNEDVPFIFDFVQKSPNLKLVSGPVCIPSHQLSLLAFKSLKLLEIHRVPILHVHGLHHIAKHIKKLICNRSTNSIKDVVYQFGKDFNGVLTLPELETLDLSYNTISCLDDSLKLLPLLENLNLCYNCLGCAESDSMPPVRYLNLGFNSITKVPSYPLLASYSIRTLVLCNNSLTNLEGVEMFHNLEFLDISSNCLVRFDDILPLSMSQSLASLYTQGNPIQFLPNYRLETLSRLSPVVREETITLDGQELNDREVMILGMNVRPQSLMSYVQDTMIERTSISSTSVPDPAQRLAEREPLIASTPNGIRSKGTSQKRKSARVRDAFIFDQNSQLEASEAEDPKEKSIQSTNVDTVSSLVRNESFSSRRSSIDNAILWIHKNSSGDVLKEKVKQTAEQEESEEASDSIYATVSNDIDSLSISSESSISIVSDDDDASVFLLESVVSGDKNCMDEKESLFVFFKHPYLIEKDPITGKVVKLDLNYLQEVTPFPNGMLRVSLRFDLVRSDRRKRIYLFEDIDHAEEFDEFVGHLMPIARRNRQMKESSLDIYLCLKCSTTFQRRKQETSFALCPGCSSSMVVENTPVRVIEQEISKERPPEQEVATDLNVKNPAGENLSFDQDSSTVPSESQAENTGVQRNPSFEVLARFGDANYQRVTGDSFSVFPLEREEPLSLPSNDTTQQSKEAESKQSDPVILDTVTENLEQNPATTKTLNDVSSKIENLPKITMNGSSPENNPSPWKQINELKTALKSKLSGSSISLTSSGGKASAEESRCSTPSASHESRNSMSSRSQSVTPMQGSTANFIVVNEDDLTRCDHRLKLYFSMDLFHVESEEFRCMIKCPYVKYDRPNIEDCLLMVSTANIYLFKLRCPESDSAKEWLQLSTKYRFAELKYIDHGYFSQSFRLEFERDFGSYKFLIGDSQRCQGFFGLLLRAVQDAVVDKQSLPIVMNDPNPRTETNIRSQIFGLDEEPVSLAKRLFEQATIFTIPPLLKSKKIRIRTHQCVSGKDLVSWMVSRREAKSRKDAIALCQKLVDVGLVYHVSKEFQFQDTDDFYKFDFSDNPKKMSSAALHKGGGIESTSSENNIDELEMSTEVCLYLQGQARTLDDDSSFQRRSIIITKSHFFLAVESHQWPLSRIYQPPSFLKEQFKLVASQRVIDLIKITFFEDSPNSLMLEFVDELGDVDSRESTWLFLIETIREMEGLARLLKTIWQEEMKVELMSEVFPSINLFI